MTSSNSLFAAARKGKLRRGEQGTLSNADNPQSSYVTEVAITRAVIALTAALWVAVTWETTNVLVRFLLGGELGASFEQALFIAIIQALLYGNFVYQFTRLGYLQRRLAHRPLSAEHREALYERDVPTLVILVPAYKEELAVVRRALLSAALQDYPDRRVVLLLDDPPRPAEPLDRAALELIRELPGQLQRMLDSAAEPFARAQRAFLQRAAGGNLQPRAEATRLASLYDEAAWWAESTAQRYPVVDHVDRLFIDASLRRFGRAHCERADALLSLSRNGNLSRKRIEREYRRLAALFRVEITVFERKRYTNLSREPNKAMNLNSYVGLLGQSWREVQRGAGLELEPAIPGPASLTVPDADFIITLDADSVLVPEYALILANEMLCPGNERLAVAQTPYITIPDAPGRVEQIAGATTDIQYLIHQGFTRYGATYWVGANAMLRVAALRDIAQVVHERGFEVTVFIQDRTVIEDTESSVDMVAHGWKLYNYPERLAYSATPPDFGTLLIQRRRWANGGLLILPKLLRYLVSGPHRLGKIAEGFFRIHYLGSIAAVNIGLPILLGHAFETSIKSVWLPLTALPYFFLYARDLRYSGYRMRDLAGVYALNLLLIPVNLAGVFKSLHQMVTGRRSAFGRTPKISGRTATPGVYVLAEYGLLASWLLGFGFDVAAQRWASAVFCFANALMLAYAIASFIGIRQGVEDLRSSLARRWRSKAAQTSKSVGVVIPLTVSRTPAITAPQTFQPTREPFSTSGDPHQQGLPEGGSRVRDAHSSAGAGVTRRK